MAQIHMLKNEEIDWDEMPSVSTKEEKHGVKEICTMLLYVLVGILLTAFSFKILLAQDHFIWDIVRGSNQNYDLMPSWIQWGIDVAKNIAGHYISVDIDIINVLFHTSGLLNWVVSLIFTLIKLVLILVVDLLIFIFAKIVSLSPFLLILAVGLFGIRLCARAIFLTGDDDVLFSMRNTSENEIRESGEIGERIAREQLEMLPDAYHVFGNLQFEYQNRRGELRPGEADFLIVGPSGLHLVEVKHWSGTISAASNDRVVMHTKTNGTCIEEKSPFYQATSNSGKLGTQLRSYTKVASHVNAHVFFTDDRLTVNMQIPAECTMHRIDEQRQNFSLTSEICKGDGQELTSDEVERIANTIYNKVWKREFSPAVMHYLGK